MATANVVEKDVVEPKAEPVIDVRNTKAPNGLGLKGWLEGNLVEQTSDGSDEDATVGTSIPEPEPKVEEKKEKTVTAKSPDKPVEKEASDASVKVKTELTASETAKLLKERDRTITRLGQTNAAMKDDLAALKQQIADVNAKLDGTYDPKKAPKADDNALQQAELRGVVKTSKKIAARAYAKEHDLSIEEATDYIDSQLFSDGAPFREYDKNAAVQTRVLTADSPIEEALAVLKEAALKKQYGDDLTGMIAKITEEVTAKLKQDLAPVPKEKKVIKTPPVGVGPDAPGVAGGKPQKETADAPTQVDMNVIFPWLKNMPFGST